MRRFKHVTVTRENGAIREFRWLKDLTITPERLVGYAQNARWVFTFPTTADLDMAPGLAIKAIDITTEQS